MSVATHRGMARFQCIAERCEDNCCQHLVVPLTDDDATRVRAALATGATPQLDESWLTPLTPSVGDHHARFQHRVDGTCRALEGGRCSLQSACGAASLPRVCSSFPRVLTQIGDALELAGSLGCPEVVRQVLVADDGLEPDAIEESQLSRAISECTRDELFAEERAAAIEILRTPGMAVADRLACFASWALSVDAADPDIEGARRAASRSLEPEDLRRAVAQEARALDVPTSALVRRLLDLIAAHAKDAAHPRLRALAADLLAQPDAEREPWWIERWAQTRTNRGSELELLLERLAVHRLLRHGATAQSWTPFAFELIARLSLHAAGLAIHPLSKAAPVSEWAPQVIQPIAKYIELAAPFRTLMYEGRRGELPEVFARAVAFSRVLA